MSSCGSVYVLYYSHDFDDTSKCCSKMVSRKSVIEWQLFSSKVYRKDLGAKNRWTQMSAEVKIRSADDQTRAVKLSPMSAISSTGQLYYTCLAWFSPLLTEFRPPNGGRSRETEGTRGVKKQSARILYSQTSQTPSPPWIPFAVHPRWKSQPLPRNGPPAGTLAARRAGGASARVSNRRESVSQAPAP